MIAMPCSPQTLAKPAQGRGAHESLKTWVGDITKILHGTGFFDRADDVFIAELSQSSQERNGDGDAQGMALSAFVGVIEGRETLDDGRPGNEAAQEDEVVSGVGQMSADPLRIEGLFKRVCYHRQYLLRA